MMNLKATKEAYNYGIIENIIYISRPFNLAGDLRL